MLFGQLGSLLDAGGMEEGGSTVWKERPKQLNWEGASLPFTSQPSCYGFSLYGVWFKKYVHFLTRSPSSIVSPTLFRTRYFTRPISDGCLLPLRLTSAKPFIWKFTFIFMQIKLIFIWKLQFRARTRFEMEAKGNSEMAYCDVVFRVAKDRGPL